MKQTLTTIALSPLLLVQAIATRRSTPVLPEPPGARAGAKGNGPVLRLLVLGDSAAAGVGAPHQDQALSGQLVSKLSARHRVEWRLLARTGHKTIDTIARLETINAEAAIAVEGENANIVNFRTGTIEAQSGPDAQATAIDVTGSATIRNFGEIEGDC